MNMLLLFDDDFFDSNRVRLKRARLRAMCDGRSVRPGDVFRVGVLNGRMGSGRVISFDHDSLDLAIVLDCDPPPPPALTLILAMPRPKMLRRIVQSVASFGVKRLFIIKTWRVDKSYFSTPFLSNEMLRAQMILGLEQACDTVLPRIEIYRRFRPFVEDVLPSIVQGSRLFIAHPGAALECPRGVAEPVVLAVGPEGGFLASEIQMMRAVGFIPVSLGPRILRVEDAVAVLLGRIV